MDKQAKLIDDITNLNGVLGARWLFEQIKDMFPEVSFMDMGYEGGYSPRLVDGKLTDYNDKEYDGPDTIEEIINSRDMDFAFGTVCIMGLDPDDGCATQMYHNGRTWALETFEGEHIAGTDARDILAKFKAWHQTQTPRIAS